MYVMESQGSRSYVGMSQVCKAHDRPVFQYCIPQTMCFLQAMKERSAKSTGEKIDLLPGLLHQLGIQQHPLQFETHRSTRVNPPSHQAQVLLEQTLQQRTEPKEG